MISLKEYFNLPNKLDKSQFDEGTYGAKFLKQKTIDLSKDTQVVLFGVEEARNSYCNSFSVDINYIRGEFYKLSEVPNINIVDLGNLKLGNTVKDTYIVLEQIVSDLISNKIIPIILGGTQELTYSIIKGVEINNKEYELSVIDSTIDIKNEELHSQSYLNYIFNNKNVESRVSIIGYQSYFVTDNLFKRALDKDFDLYRLGEIRNDFLQVESIFRDSDMVSLDMSAIRQSDNPAVEHISTNGLYAEEACQLANFAGLSDKLKVFSIFEYNKQFDIRGQSAKLISQIIWYFLFGLSKRKGDYPRRDIKTYKKIYVKLDQLNFDIVFYKNIENKRYWIEVPIGNNKNKIISCSEADYVKTINNEIPDRIWKNISRIS